MFRQFLDQLTRRRVIRTLAFYTGFVIAGIQVISAAAPILAIPAAWQRLAVIGLLGGYPVVFYLSWFYQLERGRLVRARDGHEDAPVVLRPVHWLGLLLIVAGSVAVVALAYRQLSTLRADPANAEAVAADAGADQLAQAVTLAVLPFRDQSPERDQQWFAEGLAEELTGLLGQQAGLQVAAASSSFVAAARGLDPVAAGRALAVSRLLGGSVAISGDRLKLRVELIDAGDGHILWSQSYSRQLRDAFAVQEEIARAVANRLQDLHPGAGDPGPVRTASADAYVLYLKGREQYRKQTTEAMKAARRYFEQAIGTDPEYAMAYVGLADSIVLLAKGRSKLGILEPDIAAQLADEPLAKALTRAPELAEAHAIRGKVLELQGQGDELALAAYDKALTLNPSLAVAHMWRYLALDRLGRKQEGMAALERAFLLDPLSVTLQYNRGFELSRRGRHAEARAQYEALIAQAPDSPMGYQGLADAAFQAGDWALSLQNWKQAMDRSPDNPNFRQAYVGVLLSLGLLDAARPLAGDAYFRATLLLRSGDYPALFADMAFQLQAHPDDAWLRFEAGWYELLVGDAARGRELLAAAHAGIADAERYAMPYCSPAIEMAHALMQLGRRTEARTLADQCRQRLALSRHQGLVNITETYLAARLAALDGNTDAALDELETAYAQGWREWWSARDPLLAPVRDHQRARAVFAGIDAALAAERERAARWLASLPPASAAAPTASP